CWSPWASARTWAARPRSRRRSAPPRTWAPTGPAATTARAITRASTSRRASSRARPRRRTWSSRRTTTRRTTPWWSSARTRKPDHGRDHSQASRHRRRPLQRRPYLGRPALPAHLALEGACGRLLGAEELQLLVLLRLARDAGAGDPDRLGHLPHHELQARRGERLRVGRVHHARRARRLAHPLHPFHRRLDVLHLRVPAHGQRAHVRQLPHAARARLDLRRADLPLPHGRGVL